MISTAPDHQPNYPPFSFSEIVGAVCALVGSFGSIHWFVDRLHTEAFHSPDLGVPVFYSHAFVLAGFSLLFLGRSGLLLLISRLLAVMLFILGCWAFLFFADVVPSLSRSLPDLGLFPSLEKQLIGVFTFVLAAASLFFSGYSQTYRLSQILSLLICLVGFLTLTGYLYGSLMHFGMRHYAPIDPLSAVLFVGLAHALFLRQPDVGYAKLITANTVGGWIFRRLLPFVIGTPLLIGWAQLAGEQSQQFDSAFRIAIMMVALMVIFLGALWSAAVGLNKFEEIKKQAEGLVEESEKSYREQFENSSVVMILSDPETGAIVDVNKAACTFYGYTAETLRGQHLSFINPLPKQEIQRLIKTIQDDRGGRFEFQHILADGSLRDVEAATSLIKMGQRTVLHSIIRDVTDRKAAERKLQESERRYRLLMENSVAGMASHEVIYNPKGEPVNYRFLAVNKAFEVLTSLKAQDIVGQLVTDVLPGIELKFIQRYADVVRTGEPLTFEEYTETLKRYYAVSAYKLSENQFGTVFTDVTQRKMAEEALREREAFLSLLLETIPIPIFYKDADKRFILVNKAFETLHWVKRQDIIGKKAASFAPPDLVFVGESADDKLLKEPGSAAYYAQIVDSLGVQHEVIFQKASFVNAHGEIVGIMGTILNITDQKRLEDELQETKGLLQETTEWTNELIKKAYPTKDRE